MGCSYDPPEYELTEEQKWFQENNFTYRDHLMSFHRPCGIMLFGTPYQQRYLRLHLEWCPVEKVT